MAEFSTKHILYQDTDGILPLSIVSIMLLKIVKSFNDKFKDLE